MKILFDFGAYDDTEYVLMEAPFTYASDIANFLTCEVIAYGEDLKVYAHHSERNVLVALTQVIEPLVPEEKIEPFLKESWEKHLKMKKEYADMRASGNFQSMEQTEEDFRSTYLRYRENQISRNKIIEQLIHDIKTF